MSAAHTPGPWRVNESEPRAAINSEGRCVAWCGMYPDTEAHANARLIAAAPTMLAALREAADLRAALCRGSEGGDPTTWDAPLNRWLAAIARAEGRP